MPRTCRKKSSCAWQRRSDQDMPVYVSHSALITTHQLTSAHSSKNERSIPSILTDTRLGNAAVLCSLRESGRGGRLGGGALPPLLRQRVRCRTEPSQVGRVRPPRISRVCFSTPQRILPFLKQARLHPIGQ